MSFDILLITIQSVIMLKGQDIVLLLKLAVDAAPKAPRQLDLAQALGLSQVRYQFSRPLCGNSGFSIRDQARARASTLESSSTGWKYVFPASGGANAGLPTAWRRHHGQSTWYCDMKSRLPAPEGSTRGATSSLLPTVPRWHTIMQSCTLPSPMWTRSDSACPGASAPVSASRSWSMSARRPASKTCQHRAGAKGLGELLDSVTLSRCNHGPLRR